MEIETPALATVPERLAHARKLAGLAQSRLGKIAGLSRALVGHIETGEPDRGLDTNTATALCRVLGLSLDWLILGVGEPPSEASIKEHVGRAVAADKARSDEDESASESPAA